MKITPSIDDLRQLARRRVPRAFFEYADSGSYTEQTFHANLDDLAAIKLRQRVLVNVDNRDLSTKIIGTPAEAPIALAPIGLCGMESRRRRNTLRARGASCRHSLHAFDHVDLLDRGRRRRP